MSGETPDVPTGEEHGDAGSEDIPVPEQYVQVSQTVQIEAGYATLIGQGTAYVFHGTQRPAFRLEVWQREPEPDASRLREVASRMLNARWRVVGFTGRTADLLQLSRWRDYGPRLSARWLYGDGGQGKSRLAAELATESVSAGWKVLTATLGHNTIHRPGTPANLRVSGHAGVLLIVDYANEWRSADLSWLLSDHVLHHVGIPARVLLIARAQGNWMGLASRLEEAGGDLSVQGLGPLTGSERGGPRMEMFSAARTAFAARYGLTGAERLGPPVDLGNPDFGLTLAVHMAALVAVDAAARGKRSPRAAGMADLTSYLLGREYKHWESQYGDPTHELDPGDRSFFTPPDVMNRVVFTAALTGPAPPQSGAAVLTAQHLPFPGTPQILADHAVCYPPADPDLPSVLEPLYPDRLAEDFLALTIPGNATVQYPSQEWAAETTTLVLCPQGNTLRQAEDDTTPPWIARALIFLAAAAARWPHVGPMALYQPVTARPRLALAGGSAPLSALAAIDRDRGPVLEAGLFAMLALVHQEFPSGRDTDLDAGMADVTGRLVDHVLAGQSDPAIRVRWLCDHGIRLGYAGQPEQAAERFAAAEPIARKLARRGRPEHESSLAFVLSHLGTFRFQAGERHEAVGPTAESVRRYQRLADVSSDEHLPDLALAAGNLSMVLSGLGRYTEAFDAAEVAISSLRALAKADRAAYIPRLVAALGSRSIIESELGRYDAALETGQHAVTLCREVAAANPAEHLPMLASSLGNLGNRFEQLGRPADALGPSQEADEILRRLTKANPAAHRQAWSVVASNLGLRLSNLGAKKQAREYFEEAVTAARLMVEDNQAAYLPDLARYLMNLGTCLMELGRLRDARAPLNEALSCYVTLADAVPDAYSDRLARALGNSGVLDQKLGNLDQSATALERSAAILRELAKQNAEAYAPQLVLVLHNLADTLRDLGRVDEAESMAREAVTLAQEPERLRSAADLPGTAMALLSLADSLAGQDRDREAAETSGKAVDIFRGLARGNAHHQASLAIALHNHGIHLASVGETSQAQVVLEESITLCRPLAEENPAAHTESLGTSLFVLGCVLLYEEQEEDEASGQDEAGDHKNVKAVAALEESAKAFGVVAELRTTTTPLRPAAKTNEISETLLEAGFVSQAITVAEASADRFRRLAAADPKRYRAALGLSLACLSRRAYNDFRVADSKAIGQESLTILRGLTDAERLGYADELREAERRVEVLRNVKNPWAG